MSSIEFARDDKILLLLGPPGVGKTTLIARLVRSDNRFSYVSPYVTRRLRTGEADKIAVSENELDEFSQRGELLAINSLYGVRYGTPRAPIEDAFARAEFPTLDWPVAKVSVMEAAFPGRLFKVYVEPPSLSALMCRLRDRFDKEIRIRAAADELASLARGEFDDVIDLRIVNQTGNADRLAAEIASAYYSAVEGTRHLSGPHKSESTAGGRT